MKPKPCPVEGCKKTWLTLDGLGLHLHTVHSRNELIKAILKMLEAKI